MTSRKILSLAFAALCGCDPGPEDFIEAEGAYGDGRPVSFREQLRRFACDSTKAEAPCVSLMGLRLAAPQAELLRGIRITYTPSKMASEMTYSSGLFEPVTLYIVQARADRFLDSSVHGGEIRFTSLATTPGETTAGTFRNMVLRRSDDDGNETILVTLSRGSFQYLQP